MIIPISEWLPGDTVEVHQPLLGSGKVMKWHGIFDGLSERGWPWVARVMLGGLATECDPDWCHVIRCKGVKVGDVVEWEEQKTQILYSPSGGTKRAVGSVTEYGIVRDLIDDKHVLVTSTWPHKPDREMPVKLLRVISPARHPFTQESEESNERH